MHYARRFSALIKYVTYVNQRFKLYLKVGIDSISDHVQQFSRIYNSVLHKSFHKASLSDMTNPSSKKLAERLLNIRLYPSLGLI